MTISLDGLEVGLLASAFSMLFIVVAVLAVWMLVRPPRHVRQRRKAEREGEIRRDVGPDEAEQMLRLIDRMEARIAVLERLLEDQVQRPALGRDTEQQQDLTPVEHDRETGGRQ